MVTDPASGYGLQPIRLSDQNALACFFAALREPLSDYTFSQLYTWSHSLRIYWKLLEHQLCVFANGAGDLTLLLPPIGPGDPHRALGAAYQIMDDYNADHGVPSHSRIEYVSQEMLARFDSARVEARPMGCDYLYDVQKMIELPGGDLASKRQAKNRFMRNFQYRVEPYQADRHLESCRQLLGLWKAHQDASHAEDPSLNAIKRSKESRACELTLDAADQLALRGLVVYVKDHPEHQLAPLPTDAQGWAIRGFTFGETLGPDQCSITIEKTDLSVKGLAQFIFSEFCRACWSGRPLVNVGDDWGLDTLAWTKMSYRPVKLLQKYVVRQHAPVSVAMSTLPALPASCLAQRPEAPASVPAPAVVRPARKQDVEAAVELEQTCFSAFSLSKRQLQYLQKRPSTVFLVAEQEGQVIGEGICLVRQHKRKGRVSGLTGRIYSLAVEPRCRGQKIGKRLLQAMLDDLTARGVQRIYLEVEQSNTNAIALYQQHGFTPLDTLPDYYGAGRDGVHMLCQVK